MRRIVGTLTGNFDAATLGKNLPGVGMRGVVNAGVGQAIYGREAGSFGRAWVSSLAGDLAAVGANAVGKLSAGPYSPSNILGHAAVGAAAARMRGQDPWAGAIGAGMASIINPTLDRAIGGPDGMGWGADPASAQYNQQLTLQLSSTLAAGAVLAAARQEYLTAMQAAHNETVNNYLTQENIKAKYERLAQAKTDKERQNIEREFKQISQENDVEAVDRKSKWIKQEKALWQQREHLVRRLGGPWNEEVKTTIKGEIVGIDRQLVLTERSLLNQGYRDREGLVALSQDLNQPEHIRQEALRNIEMIDGDLRFAQVVDKYHGPAITAVTLVHPLGRAASWGSLFVKGLLPRAMVTTAAKEAAIGALVSGAVDTSAQLFKGEEFRYGQTVAAMINGALFANYASSSVWKNAVIGGTVNLNNTIATNQIYDKRKSLGMAFTIGGAFSGFGTYIGNRFIIYSSNNAPAYIAGERNPYPAKGGELIKQFISESHSFMRLDDKLSNTNLDNPSQQGEIK